jgi:AcrR family transcriptional regulator
MSTAAPGVPIWARPEPGARRPRFTREQIAAAALAIADEEGFEVVSMRRVAARLGAGTMTLYHYVRSKDDLLVLMDDALMAEVLVHDGELDGDDWRAALAAIARRTRAVFVRHPWALLSLLGTVPGPNGMRHFEQCLAALAHLPLDTAAKLELLGRVDDFVFGHVLRASEARNLAPHDERAVDAIATFVEAQLASGRFPHLQALQGSESLRLLGERITGLHTDEERFERGLDALLEGSALQLGLDAR